MKDFVAITESGAVYRVQNGFVNYQGRQGSYGFALSSIRSVDRRDLTSFADILNLPAVDMPTVGLSLYLDGPDEWRLSTPVSEVHELVPGN